jgi:hypothetical protein
MNSFWQEKLYNLLNPRVLSGEADVDVSAAVYTGYVELMRIEPVAAIRDLVVDLDFNKATTGWDAVSTASDTLDVAIFAKVDGTNYRYVEGATQLVAVGGAAHTTAGRRFKIGAVDTTEDISIRVKLSAERSDFEVPYRINYCSETAPSITAVAIP